MARTVLYFAAACILTASCRTTPRTGVDPSAPVAVTVTLYQLPEAAVENYKLNVQMGLCGESSGIKVDATSYKFMVPSLAPGSICQVRLTGPKDVTGGIHFFSNSEGLYYKDDQVTIRQDSTGALRGDAYIQALFSTGPVVVTNEPPASTVWQITAPVTSKAALVDTCTCKLECAPELTNYTALMAKGNNPGAGSCSFANPTRSGVTTVQCRKLTLQCGEAFYAASYDPVAKVDTTGGKTTTLPSVELLSGTPTPDGDVTIDVQIKNKPAGN